MAPLAKSLFFAVIFLRTFLSYEFAAQAASVLPFQRGVSLGLFSEDPQFDYQPLLQEIAATGADHVALVIPYYQHNWESTSIGPHPRFSPSAQTIERVMKQARAAGLRLLVFPILRLEYAVTVDEWRGALQPRDEEQWWKNYRDFILHFAQLSSRHQAAVLCVGSELGAMDTSPERWKPIIDEIRRVFKGSLVYSANWDHYDKVKIWPLVDIAGISSYFSLTDGREPRDLPRLVHGWREHRVTIARWRAQINKPLIFTELGYHSQQGTNAWPWDEAAQKPIDLNEQAACYRAFARVWQSASWLYGVYFWNWFCWGGPQSGEYCPRGKPAAQIVCSWFGVPDSKCPRTFGQPNPINSPGR